MGPTLRKDLRILLLPVAIAIAAAFVCGVYYVNDPQPRAAVEVRNALLQLASAWSPGILCLSLAIVAGLVFGAEYQYRTLPLLLTQPLPRSRIWNQKSSMLGACAGMIVLAWFVGSRVSLHFHLSPGVYSENEASSIEDVLLSFAAFFVATLGSAAFWSFITRSVIGGIVLNSGFQLLTGLCVALVAERLFKLKDAWRVVICASPIYALAFLWLGRQKFLNLQVTSAEGAARGRTASFLGLKRETVFCRVTRVNRFRNLIRKEVRLNKPLFLIAGFFVPAWFLCRLLLKAAHADKTMAESALVGVTVVYECLIFGLAGAVSLGEDKSTGTHASQLLLPIAKWKLWSTKLIVAWICSVLLGGVLPAALWTPSVSASEFRHVHWMLFYSWVPFAMCFALTVIGFWAAAHVQNAVVAVLIAMLFLPALAIANGLGMSYEHVLDACQAPILSFVSLRFHLSPAYFDTTAIEFWFFPCVVSPVLCAIMLVQSFKEFGRLRQTRSTFFVHFLILSAFTFFMSAWFADFSASASQSCPFAAETKKEILRAAAKCGTARQALERRWTPLPWAELAATGELSKTSAEWLRGSCISVCRYDAQFAAQVIFPHEKKTQQPWIIDIPTNSPAASVKPARPQNR